MFILLFIFAALFACRIPDKNVRVFIYSCLIITVILNTYKYISDLHQNNVICTIHVIPNTRVIVWTDAPLKIYNTIFDSPIYSTILSSDSNGKVTFEIEKSSIKLVDNISKETIYYRYLMNNNKLSNINKTYINNVCKSYANDVSAPAPTPTPTSTSTSDKSLTNHKVIFAPTQTIGNNIDEKIDNLTIRRLKIIKLDPVLEENTEDLLDYETSDSKSTFLDKIYDNSSTQTFNRPLEAILDDRAFGTKINHKKLYENDLNMYGNLAKFT